MFGLSGKAGYVPLDSLYVNNETFLILLVGIIGCTPVGRILKTFYLRGIEDVGLKLSFPMKITASLVSLVYLVGIFVFSTMFLASGTYNPFIYFRF